MSISVEGEKCPVCSAYLFDEDDIVYCPVCGAPHHRGCYATVGHCALEALHGTSRQYTRQSRAEQPAPEIKSKPRTAVTVKCGMCGEEYDRLADGCPKCGTPNVTKMGGRYARFDFLGGVPADMDLGSGVKADEAKRFVASNTHRYIPKFASMLAGKRLSWNWLAFIFPCGWFLSRKMYLAGSLVGALSVAFSMFTIPFSRALAHFDLTSVANYMQMAQLISDNISTIGMATVIVAAVGSMLNILLSILCGTFGDYLYRNHSLDTISKIKSESIDVEEDFRRKGGVSLIALMIGWFAVQYLPSVLAMLFGL